MTPIVSPWLVYLIGVCQSVHLLVMVLSFALLFAIGILVVDITRYPYDESDRYYDKEEAEKVRQDNKPIYKYIRYCVVALIMCGIANVVVPTKDTATQMLAASIVTPDNIQAVQGNIVDFIKQVSEVINHGN